MRSTKKTEQISLQKAETCKRIKNLEKEGRFEEDILKDASAKELLPNQVDYLSKKFSTRMKTRTANLIADRYFLRQIKKGKLLIDGIEGEEYLSALANGAVVTCNHFSIFDHYIVFHCIRKYLPKKYLYKVIKEGNYTSFGGLFGFFMRHCNTLPLSRNRRTMMNFTSAVQTLLKRGETVLVYPEQSMWPNYPKPRPFKAGAFKMAYRAGVPVLPVFITMQPSGKIDKKTGEELQKYTVHCLPPVYPDFSLGEKLGAQEMGEVSYQSCKAQFEKTYGKPLVFCEENA